MFSEFYSSNWHPVTWLSYAIDFSLWGENAPAFKLTNIVIHLLNSILVFYLTYLILSIIRYSKIKSLTVSADNWNEILAAMVAALLFAVHPQHVESVAWVSGRKDLLCAFFYFSAVIAYLHQHYANKKSFWKNLSLVAFMLSLMSKSMAITLPVILIILDIYPLNKTGNEKSIAKRIRHLAEGKLLYFFLAGMVLIITLITQTSNITDARDYTVAARMANSSTNYFYYIYSIISPGALSPYHPLQSNVNNLSWVNWASIILFVAIFSVSYIAYRNNHKFPFIVLTTYLILLLPAIGLLHLGHAVRADRYAYIPTTVFYMLIGYAVAYASTKIIKHRWQTVALIFTVLIFTILLSLTTYQHSKAWMNDKTVWQKVIYKYPDSAATAYVNLGNALFEEKQFSAAISHYIKAIRMDPLRLEAIRNLGLIYENLNDHSNAEKYYKLMVETRPDIHYPYTVLGDYYFNTGKYPQAAPYYQKALEISPSFENALYKSSLIDLLNGDLKRAEQKIDYLLQLRPNDIEGLQIKVQIRYAQKDFKSAEDTARTILQLDPTNKVANLLISKINRLNH
jgi:Tfp pilus assembly protein PilF